MKAPGAGGIRRFFDPKLALFGSVGEGPVLESITPRYRQLPQQVCPIDVLYVGRMECSLDGTEVIRHAGSNGNETAQLRSSHARGCGETK